MKKSNLIIGSVIAITSGLVGYYYGKKKGQEDKELTEIEEKPFKEENYVIIKEENPSDEN